ncbi:MAG: response regulator, partial [Gammaproteobacteria bacterium]
TEEPQAETEEPQAETEEPQAETEEPQAETEEPQVEAEEPQVETEEPQAETEEHSIGKEDLDPVLCDIFSKEADEHLNVVEEFILAVEEETYATQDIVRALHTLTGSARMAEASDIAEMGHLLDIFVRGFVERQIPLKIDEVETLTSGVDVIREQIKFLTEKTPQVRDYNDLKEYLQQAERDYDARVQEDSGIRPVSEDIDSELIEIFIEEADDIISFLETTMQSWEADPLSETIVAELHRSLHTLKGGSRLAGFSGIGDLCHILETASEKIASGHVKANEECFDLINNSFDRLADMVEQARNGLSVPASEELLKSIENLIYPDTQGDIENLLSSDITEEQDSELVEVFLEEGDEIITAGNEVLQKWIDDPDNSELIVELQRALHTLKGGARMAGFWPIGDLGHAFETLLVDVLEGRLAASTDMFDVLETVQDRLHDMLQQAGRGEKVSDGKDLIALIETLRSGDKTQIAEKIVETAVAETIEKKKPQVNDQETLQHKEGESHEAVVHHEMVRVRADLLDDLVNYAGEVSIYRARTEQQVSEFRTNLEEMDQTVARLREQLRKMEIETEAQILFRYERDNDSIDKEDFDPLELDRFSQIQQLSRSLGESLNDLHSIGGFLDQLARDSETLLLQQSRVNTELQEGLMKTRMVPFSNMVPRMRRVVRQTCAELGKKAQLKVIGAQGEMDRNVLERVIAPLEHMLRNSVAHGIESPKDRAACLKEESGTITISLSREGPDIVIRVVDDGAGINHEAIRHKAISLGWMTEDSTLSDTEIVQFILETGFSTASSVTQISGRGVGMDVVNNEIKQLGGTLGIVSEKGQGTEFTIRLPFTLALNHALLVNVSDDTFAIPLSAIDGIVRMKHEQLEDFFNSQDEAIYEYAGQRYNVVNAAVLLGVGSPILPGNGKRTPVVLVQSGDHKLALHVDGLLGSREIVVKAVGPQISSVPGIMGATILGNGKVVLILDIGALVRTAVSSQLEEIQKEIARNKRVVSRFMAMVVDDSITVRKVTSRLLERNGFEVVTAKDGVDAVTQMQEQKPDIVLLDVEMPRMDGFEVATHMKNDLNLKDVPIIMITSRTGDKHRERASRIGVDHYMGKPYQENDLINRILKLLGISGYGR